MIDNDSPAVEYPKEVTAAEALTQYALALKSYEKAEAEGERTRQYNLSDEEAFAVEDWASVLAQLTAMSHALAVVGLSSADPAGTGNDAKWFDEIRQAVALMQASGEMTRREKLYQEFGREWKALPLSSSQRVSINPFGDDEHNRLLNRFWIDAAQIAEEYRAFYSKPFDLTKFGRSGSKLRVVPAEQLRLPMTEYVKDALMSLGRGEFIPTEGKDAVFSDMGKAQLRIECDAIGFDALRAVEIMAASGPAAMQTFLGLMGLWIENNSGASYETYFTARASDLMRYMHRKELAGGGYHTKDQMAKGKEVYILSRATIPKATKKVVNSKNGQRTVETLSLDRLLHVQSVMVQRTLEDGQEIQSILEFRYHPNKEIHEMLCGDTPQFAQASGKLLAYHPVTHKYHILLGFGLAFYDKVNHKKSGEYRKIGLPALLHLSGISVPKTNVERFLTQIQKAILDLDRDGVISGAQINFPAAGRKAAAITVQIIPTRKKIEGANVTFPVLLAKGMSSR